MSAVLEKFLKGNNFYEIITFLKKFFFYLKLRREITRI